MTRRRPVVAALASALSLALVAVACSGGSSKKLIPPPPSTAALLTTAPPGTDLTAVALAPVPGRLPAGTVEILGGDSTLAGVISGPDGPVAGATVRLERFVGDAVAKLDIVSNADGTWRAPQPVAPPAVPTVTTLPLLPGQLPTIPPPTTAAPPPPPTVRPIGPQGILGGRYRVRAWRTPDLALTTPQIMFLEAKQNRQLGLQLSRYTGTTVSSVSSPDPPVLNAIVSVTAVVTTASVSGEGIVSAVPLPNATVSLSVGPGWLFVSGASVTNTQGRATFQLRCQALGQSTVDLTVNGTQSYTLPVRACVAPAPTTTTSLLDPGSSTSSSSIPGGGSTSSTRSGPPTT